MKRTKSAVTRKKIAGKIYRRFGSALKQRIILDAINIICVTLHNDILQDRAVSVENFGTFSPYRFHEHRAMNIATGQIEKVKSFRTVKFRPHFTLLELVSQRRESFLGKKSAGGQTKRVDRS